MLFSQTLPLKKLYVDGVSEPCAKAFLLTLINYRPESQTRMALRAVRARVTTRDFVVGVTSLAAAVASVSDMASFPPARAAAMVLLVILQTVQEIQTNKDECFRLARRATKILLDLKQRMEGRWESAPAALVENITEFKKCGDCQFLSNFYSLF